MGVTVAALGLYTYAVRRSGVIAIDAGPVSTEIAEPAAFEDGLIGVMVLLWRFVT
jgi:hypothetical protein